jgi:hypothetical protein
MSPFTGGYKGLVFYFLGLSSFPAGADGDSMHILS